MTVEKNQKMADGMEKVLPVIKQYITTKADEMFTTDVEKLDFMLSCAVNLVGNLTMHVAGENPDRMKQLAHNSLVNLSAWFDKIIPHLEKLKGTH